MHATNPRLARSLSLSLFSSLPKQHMDFTFVTRDELRYWVLKKLMSHR
jgi:hypothetical protein